MLVYESLNFSKANDRLTVHIIFRGFDSGKTASIMVNMLFTKPCTVDVTKSILLRGDLGDQLFCSVKLILKDWVFASFELL